MYGMSWREFWHGDPWAAVHYRDAHNLKRRMRNEELWLQGLYIRDAVESVMGSMNGKRISYLKQPLDIFPKTKAEKEAEIEAERKKLIEYLSAFKANSDARNQKQGVGQNGKP